MNTKRFSLQHLEKAEFFHHITPLHVIDNYHLAKVIFVHVELQWGGRGLGGWGHVSRITFLGPLAFNYFPKILSIASLSMFFFHNV